MVIGIGVDIIEIDRIKQSIEKYGDSFLNKIYTPVELEYCLTKSNKYQHLAARFAAKEAVYKALTTGTQEKIGWQNIEIMNKPNGMPIVKLKDFKDDFLSNGSSLKISISHSDSYVTCFAIVYKDAP